MKKLGSLLLVFAFIFSLSACVIVGSNTESTAKKETEVTSENTLGSTAPLDSVNLKLHPEYEGIIKSIMAEFPWISPEWPKIEDFKLSLMYVRHDDISEIGCALIDVDDNGQEELIISSIDSNVIYDMFTIKDDMAVQVLSGHERNSYRLYGQGIVENTWSGGASVSGHDFYEYKDGELIFLERITLDAYYAYEAGIIAQLKDANKDNSFFRSPTKEEEDYQHVNYDFALDLIDEYQNKGDKLDLNYTSFTSLSFE